MDKITFYLGQEAFAGFTWLEVGVAAIGAIVLVKLITWMTRSRAADPNQVDVRCRCGWAGRVSKFSRICPKCSERIG